MEPLSKDAFDTLVAQTGLLLTEAQIAMLRTAHPMLATMIARVTEPLPREAEPALIYRAESI
jgi:hypothetical protein